MRLVWTEDARRDLCRLDWFLASADVATADRVVDEVIAAAEQVALFPELGPRLDGFGVRNVRRLIVGDYEVRYELLDDSAVMLRVWHVREDR